LDAAGQAVDPLLEVGDLPHPRLGQRDRAELRQRVRLHPHRVAVHHLHRAEHEHRLAQLDTEHGGLDLDLDLSVAPSERPTTLAVTPGATWVGSDLAVFSSSP